MLPYFKKHLNEVKDPNCVAGFPMKIFSDFKEDLTIKFNLTDEEWEKLSTSDCNEQITEFAKSKWISILEQILFSLEYVVNNEEPPEHLFEENPDYDPNKPEEIEWAEADEQGRVKMIRDNFKRKINAQKLRVFEERIDSGFELMGKYWRCLWW
jgi:hypothetical protein